MYLKKSLDQNTPTYLCQFGLIKKIKREKVRKVIDPKGDHVNMLIILIMKVLQEQRTSRKCRLWLLIMWNKVIIFMSLKEKQTT